jgi:formylglycine-generating enzyme required for sulfatase activity
MKAMEKARERRYGNAAALADDIGRFLKKEPVLAGPPSGLYRLKKYVRRHRTMVAATSSVILALTLGLVASIWFAVEASRSEAKAVQNEKRAVENKNEAIANEQRAIAGEQAALENEAIAKAQLEEIRRLSDIKNLDNYRLEAEKLWPATPEKVEPMEAWLKKARDLADRNPKHRQTLESLRAKALPYTEEAAKRDRESHPKAVALAELLDLRKVAEKEIAKLEKEVPKDTAATRISFGGDERKKHPTYYFRHAFEEESPEKFTALRFSLLSDGAVLYINGKELFRENMPEGAIGYGTLSVKEYKKKEEEEYRNHEKGLQAIEGSLQKGRNFLAVEVHQASRRSADLRFDLEVLGIPKEGEAIALVKKGSLWRYSDLGEDLGEGWRAPAYDDAAWKVGPGPFGYGFSGGPGLILDYKQIVVKLGEKIAGLEKEVGVRRTWEFSETLDQWWHDALRDLVGGLEAFADPDPFKGTVGSVEGRLEFARTIRKRTIEDPKAKWDEAISSIRNKEECPKYDGIVIVPQLGLVPLGRDPSSSLWEFAHVQTGEVPIRDKDGKLVFNEETGIVFVLIPGGTFRMGAVKPGEKNPEGSPNVDPEAGGDEGPVHEVKLSPFFLSKYEMTQGQWKRFTGENPSLYGPDATFGGKQHDLRHPVEQVNWEDCMRVLYRLGLALPTEAQWEYAARACTATVWWTGNEKETLRGAANIADSFLKKNGGLASWRYEEWLDDGYSSYAAVGSFRPNAFGLHDVAGNVWEWCRDWYGSYKLTVKEGDGERPVALGPCRSRVSRGGSFRNPAESARSANRSDFTPGDRYDFLGLRPARVLEP